MRRVFVAVIALTLTSVSFAQTSWLEPYRANAGKLIAAAGADQFAWDRLAELTDTYGQRLSGSDNLNRAIAWAVDAMKKDGDRKSTRLNSSHGYISYAVFCLKKKK